MPPSRILDSHIHLWPSSSTTPSSHAWMTPNHFLAKRHGISDYLSVAQPPPSGVVYVETDRHLPTLFPQDGSSESLKAWAKEPLEEVRFLRRIVEGSVQDGDGDGVDVSCREGELLKACVIWGPFHESHDVWARYMSIVEEVAGPRLWAKVVGFRYLLQGKGKGEVEKTVSSESWIDNIASLGSRFAFDVGVDIHRDGEEGLEAVGKMIENVRKRDGGKQVRFVLNHLCKPNLSQPPAPGWITALMRLGQDENVYMKLSGAFNEFDATPETVDEIVAALKPFLVHVFNSFPRHVMFGSDWPVCNVGGPKQESGNWKFWVQVVERVLTEFNLGEEEKEDIWWRTGARAYGIDSL